jgi:urea transport system permease protein
MLLERVTLDSHFASASPDFRDGSPVEARGHAADAGSARAQAGVDLRPPAIDPRVRLLRLGATAAVLALFFVLIPAMNLAGVVPDYKLNFLGKYLCFAIVALGIDLIWGYTGLLSLCQALFFCLGGYAMAMHLSLPEGGGIYDVPQFLSYVYYGHANPLPPFWRPFRSFTFAVGAGVLVPALVASVFGFFIFRSRVRGVYFSIITQAVAWGSWLLISRHEMLLGGTNGLTNFSKSLTQERKYILALYLLTVGLLAAAYALCRWLVASRLGRVLVAVRDKETRLYFAGYKPYAFKVFAFTVAAVLAAVGGMLYSPQVTIISPHNMRVEESILMVIWVALGGRGRLWGAIIGSLLVNYTYASLTSDLPAVWPFVQGAMFLAVVLLFPGGLVSLWDRVEQQVGAGGPWLRVIATAAPLAVLVLFVIGESLGLTPSVLRKVVFTIDRVGAVQLKYLVIVALLAAAGAYQYASGRRTSRQTEPSSAPAAAANGGPA